MQRLHFAKIWTATIIFAATAAGRKLNGSEPLLDKTLPCNVPTMESQRKDRAACPFGHTALHSSNYFPNRTRLPTSTAFLVFTRLS